ncbi:MAG: hypothetical protein GF375_02005, partial [Candidatus Omnitrophica bacterium]|nr:hypothetical protein [Candidatus Omnitrophota bacterium]
MNNFLHRYRQKTKKAQLFLFYILIIVVLIIAALITVGIGNVAKTKSYSSNSADSGALAGASTLATTFNYVSRANEFFEENYDRFHAEAQRHFENAWDYMALAKEDTKTAHDIACSDPCRARDMIDPIIDIYLEDKFIDEMEKLGDESAVPTGPTPGIPGSAYPYGIIPHFQRFQEVFYQKLRYALHQDEDLQFDFYNVALAAAYKLNMLNSGIMVKLPPEGKEEFLLFIDEIVPGHVYNG